MLNEGTPGREGGRGWMAIGTTEGQYEGVGVMVHATISCGRLRVRSLDSVDGCGSFPGLMVGIWESWSSKMRSRAEIEDRPSFDQKHDRDKSVLFMRDQEASMVSTRSHQLTHILGSPIDRLYSGLIYMNERI